MEQIYTFTIESKKQNIDALTEEYQQEFRANADKCEIIILKGNSYSKQFFNQFSEYITTAKEMRKINANDIVVGKGKDEIPQSLQILGNSLIGLNILSLDLSNNALILLELRHQNLFLNKLINYKDFFQIIVVQELEEQLRFQKDYKKENIICKYQLQQGIELNVMVLLKYQKHFQHVKNLKNYISIKMESNKQA